MTYVITKHRDEEVEVIGAYPSLAKVKEQVITLLAGGIIYNPRMAIAKDVMTELKEYGEATVLAHVCAWGMEDNFIQADYRITKV